MNDQGTMNGTLYQNATRYQIEAARTLIEKPLKPLSNKQIMILWNGIGLAGEAGELLEEILNSAPLARIIKELGDQYWYIAGICTKAGINFGWIITHDPVFVDMSKLENRRPAFPPTLEMIALAYSLKVATVLEYLKKAILHDHGLETSRLADLLLPAVQLLGDICGLYGLSLADVWAANIAKLTERFPDGFTTQASINRVDVGGDPASSPVATASQMAAVQGVLAVLSVYGKAAAEGGGQQEDLTRLGEITADYWQTLDAAAGLLSGGRS